MFASLGCRVIMVERHPIVAALLDDGLRRAKQDPEIGRWIRDRVTLLHSSSHEALLDRSGEWMDVLPDVVYLDPMYPHPENKKKTALVKKEMRIFQHLVGPDDDADGLLELALNMAIKRVVVKRPGYADYLNRCQPTMSINTKKNRFDVYVKASMK